MSPSTLSVAPHRVTVHRGAFVVDDTYLNPFHPDSTIFVTSVSEGELACSALGSAAVCGAGVSNISGVPFSFWAGRRTVAPLSRNVFAIFIGLC